VTGVGAASDGAEAGIVAERLSHWRLTLDGTPFRTATSTLAPARTADGAAVMLKISHHEEERRGSALLDAWRGRGAALVLEREGDAVLLERATGALALVALADGEPDAAADAVLCRTALTLHGASDAVVSTTAGDPPALTPLSTWFRQLFAHADELGPMHRRGAELAETLLDDERDVVVLHGDLHHANVLDFGERGWLAIDPKALLGDRAFDYCNLLCNPDPVRAAEPGRLETRFAAVAEIAKLPPSRFAQWLAAWCALSSTWHALDGDGAAAESVARIGERALELVDTHSRDASTGPGTG
jgi:streptomycin 6-kinase